MKNPLLVSKLQELLNKKDTKGIQIFYASVHPGTTAEILEDLGPRDAWQVLAVLEPRLRAEVFSHLNEDLQVAFAESLNRQDLAGILTHMSGDERVDFLKQLPEDKREAILPALAQIEREDIRRLASHPEGTAGAVMTSDYATLSPEQSAAEAIAKLRREAPDKETIYYSYVVDSGRRLIGFLSLKDLILARPEKKSKKSCTGILSSPT